MKSSLIVSLIALFSIIFLSSCDNNQQRVCDMPNLYLQGEEQVIVDSTENWILKTKKVVRYNSSCDSDSVDVKYYVKKGVSVNRIPYTAQGQKANLDSLLAAQKCGVVVGPVVIDNGGGNDNNGGFSGIPNWLKTLFWILLGIILLLAALWLLRELGEALFASRRRHITDPPAYRVEQPVQQASAPAAAPLAPVTTGNPQIQSTCVAGAPGSIVIPPALANLEEETISITRRYFRPTA